MDTIINWIWNNVTTNNAGIYLLTSFIGLYTNIYWSVKKEKRKPKWSDVFDLAGQIPIVWTLAIIIDNSPIIALVVGAIPDRIFDFAQNQVFKGSTLKQIFKLITDSNNNKGV